MTYLIHFTCNQCAAITTINNDQPRICARCGADQKGSK